MTELTASLAKDICMLLERDILCEKGTIKDFSEFTVSDINDLRLLKKASGVLAVAYTRFRLEGCVPLHTAVSYCSAVIENGLTIDQWLSSENG